MSAGDDRRERPSGQGWQDAQRQVHERNEAAREVAKQQRADDDRRQDKDQRARYERDGVYR